MRILQICEPPDGGAAVNATELSIHLARRGWHVEYAGPPSARRYERLEDCGIRIHRLPLAPGYSNTLDDVMALRGIRRVLRDNRFEIVHLHSAKAGVLGRLACARSRIPVLYSPHNFPFMGDHSRFRIAVATAIERRLTALTAAILCVCDWERDLALSREIAPDRLLHVIHNGSDPCAGAVEPDGELKSLRGRGPLIGAIAGLRRFKGIEDLVDAAPAVLDRVPDASIAVIGDGPLKAQLVQRARRLGLMEGGRFVFMPFAEPASQYLRSLDLYVLPSWLEAFPIGILEALACGVPQVATDVGGVNEAVTPETGRLVPPKSPGHLAAAIVELLQDQQALSAMGAASRSRHRTSFLTETMVDRTAELYEALVHAH